MVELGQPRHLCFSHWIPIVSTFLAAVRFRTGCVVLLATASGLLSGCGLLRGGLGGSLGQCDCGSCGASVDDVSATAAGAACDDANCGHARCGRLRNMLALPRDQFASAANFCIAPIAYAPAEVPPPGRFHPVPTRPVFSPRP
jgi:hypothetical protein